MERFMGRILRILVTKYRISPLQIGRKYCNVNPVVKFTENNCGEESIHNVNTSETTSSFSLLQSGAVDEYQLIRNRRLPQKNHFTIREYMWQLLKIANMFSPLPPPRVSSSINSRKIILYLKILRCIVPGSIQQLSEQRTFDKQKNCREPDRLFPRPLCLAPFQSAAEFSALPVKETKSSLALLSSLFSWLSITGLPKLQLLYKLASLFLEV